MAKKSQMSSIVGKKIVTGAVLPLTKTPAKFGPLPDKKGK